MIPLLSVWLLAAALAGGGAAPVVASLAIRHVTHGCHVWSLNGGPSRVDQRVSIKHAEAIDVINNDVMPHELVETSGPAVTYTRVTIGAPMGRKGNDPPAMLTRMGATTKITFSAPGVYRFTTKPGESAMESVPTVGADNVLRLTVRVR